MIEFFKTFGQGLIYVILSPFLLAFFSLYLVYALVTYLIMEVISIFYFFSGRNINSSDDETRELARIQESLSPAGMSAQLTTPTTTKPVVEAKVLNEKEEEKENDSDSK